MKIELTPTTKISEIVNQVPKASELFKKYQIDFCCGGNRPLIDAVKENNINEDELLEQLHELSKHIDPNNRQIVNWELMSSSRLIDHIIQTHHMYLNRELPELSELIGKILRVHGSHHPELSQVYKLYHQLKSELEFHLIQEEEKTFPLLKKYEKNPSQSLLDQIVQSINDLENEHQSVGEMLRLIRQCAEDYMIPQDACYSYQTTYEKLQELESDIFQHVHKENNIFVSEI